MPLTQALSLAATSESGFHENSHLTCPTRLREISGDLWFSNSPHPTRHVSTVHTGCYARISASNTSFYNSRCYTWVTEDQTALLAVSVKCWLCETSDSGTLRGCRREGAALLPLNVSNRQHHTALNNNASSLPQSFQWNTELSNQSSF